MSNVLWRVWGLVLALLSIGWRTDAVDPSALQGDESPAELVKASPIFLQRYIALNAAKESVDRLQELVSRPFSNNARYIDALHQTSRFNYTAIYVDPSNPPPSEKQKAAEKAFPIFKPQPDSFEADDVYQHNKTLLEQEQALGVRVVGGGRAPAGSYRWCVAVLDEDDATGCSGTLVANRLVLTARHCAKEMQGGPKNVYVGDYVGDPTGHKYGVKSVFHFPPDVPNPTRQADLMLLELDEDVPNVSPRAILPPGVLIADQGYMRIIGFGRDKPPDEQGFSSGKSGIKNVADVPLHGGSPTKLGYDPDFEFCAGLRGLNIDSCRGDSGGAAIVFVSSLNKSFLYGAVARSVKLQPGDTRKALCGNGGVYTRVDKFRDWVEQTATSIGITLPQ